MTQFSSGFSAVVAVGLVCGLSLPALAVGDTQSEEQRRIEERLRNLPAPAEESALPAPLMTREEFRRVEQLFLGIDAPEEAEKPEKPSYSPGMIEGADCPGPSCPPSPAASPAPNSSLQTIGQIDLTAMDIEEALKHVESMRRQMLENALNPYAPPSGPETLVEQQETWRRPNPPMVAANPYGYYDAGTRTPTPVTAKGSYNGILRGQTASGLALGGTVNLNVDVSPAAVSIAGGFAFDTGDTIEIYNFPAFGSYGVMMRTGDAFMGGVLDYTTDLTTAFYGPNAEQYGGTWGFMVGGGAEPGVASGDFVTKR